MARGTIKFAPNAVDAGVSGVTLDRSGRLIGACSPRVEPAMRSRWPRTH